MRLSPCTMFDVSPSTRPRRSAGPAPTPDSRARALWLRQPPARRTPDRRDLRPEQPVQVKEELLAPRIVRRLHRLAQQVERLRIVPLCPFEFGAVGKKGRVCQRRVEAAGISEGLQLKVGFHVTVELCRQAANVGIEPDRKHATLRWPFNGLRHQHRAEAGRRQCSLHCMRSLGSVSAAKAEQKKLSTTGVQAGREDPAWRGAARFQPP